MAYKSLRSCLEDLQRAGHLITLPGEIDPHLDLAELTRRVYRVGGPALLFSHVRGTPFAVASNIMGTIERSEYIFRDTLNRTQAAVSFRANPVATLKSLKGLATIPGLARAAINSLPMRSWRTPEVLRHRASISDLPSVVSWPGDGGPFLTLPQVLSFDPTSSPRMLRSNLGMYRIQLSGGEYIQDREVGMHYQLHRGLGIHHTLANQHDVPLKVAIFVGGPPGHTIAAVMPMPENMAEVMVAGMLSGRSVRWSQSHGYRILSDSDFCILGTIIPGALKPEGPFGDHLGYYARRHDFPFMRVEHVFHRPNPIMPITVVGRPPAEDSVFGALIHRLTAPMVPVSLPGIHELHAVDEAGVHPLLLAIGSERYVPYQPRRPMEIMTQALAILGFNQCSLAKYLMIAAREDNERLSTRDIKGFFQHILRRIDLRRDLHLLTCTTIDTLDYTSGELNFGSKLIVTCAGEPVRQLSEAIPQHLSGVRDSVMVMPGILAITLDHPGAEAHSLDSSPPAESTIAAPHRFMGGDRAGEKVGIREALKKTIASVDPQLWQGVPWVVVSDDARQMAGDFGRFLWETFTRSHPSDDLHGFNERWVGKHWQFDGPLFCDARVKSHHAPQLIADPASIQRVDEYIAGDPQLARLFVS